MTAAKKIDDPAADAAVEKVLELTDRGTREIG
jgi:hypothetical protein